MYMLIIQKLHWDKNVAIIPATRVQLFIHMQVITRVQWYYYIQLYSNSIVCGTNWLKSQSSSFKELKAVNLVLNTFGGKLNKFVKLYSDNQNVARTSKIGMKPLLQSLAFSICKNCLEYNRGFL
jgi:hypothetical protein